MMKSMKQVLLAAAAVTLLGVIGCKKDGTGPIIDIPDTGDSATVYVLGSTYENSVSQAILWVNGKKEVLPVDPSVISYVGNDIVVTDDQIIVAGYIIHNGNKVATVWINGEEQILVPEKYLSDAMTVTVSGSDIYVAGFIQEPTGMKPVLWKNGTATELEAEGNSAGRQIIISGNDTYVAGFSDVYNSQETRISVATLWKNGERIIYEPETISEISKLAIAGNDLYAMGSYLDQDIFAWIPAIWKNGVRQNVPGLDENTTLSDMKFANNKLYMVGSKRENNINTPYIWTNLEPAVIPVDAANASARIIYFHEDDMYISLSIIAGSTGHGRLLKNGEVFELEGVEETTSGIMQVLVR